MESGIKLGVNGAAESQEKAAGVRKPAVLASSVLRAVAAATTLVAAVLMGTDMETQTVSIQVAPTLPALPITATAKWSYSSAFVYFVAVNAMVCMYSALSLVTQLITTIGASKRNLVLPITIGDLVTVALLFSGNGAAAEFGVLGARGNARLHWHKVCHVYTKFCAKALAAVALSLLGSTAYLILVILSIVSLYRRS